MSTWLLQSDPHAVTPDMPLGADMRHVAIVKDGEVVATVWNHHHSTEAYRRAERILKALADEADS